MRKLFMLSAALVLLLAGCAPKNKNLPIEAPASVLEDLPGNYTLKTTVDDSVRYSTAVVTQIAAGEYQISRITVYGPVLYGFKLGEHAVVESEELGSGAVTYTPAIKKTTISFEKGGSLCELSK
ncbi:MAG: hypothetical protein K5843_04045 [Bacteroidales bacterium]|jgi:hypothetical protein|nr:hypothetical protein [Bacteroidales bacterium]